MGEFSQDIGHLISPFTTTDIDYDICIAPTSDCVLRHSLSGTESARYRHCPTFCQGKEHIYDSLPGNKGDREWFSLRYRSGYANRPVLIESDIHLLTIGRRYGAYHLVYRIASCLFDLRYGIGCRCIDSRWQQNLMLNPFS